MGGLPSHVGIQVAGCRRQVHGDCSSHQGNTACSMHMHCCCCRRREHPGGLRVPRCRIVKVVVVSLTCRTRCSSIPGQNELHAQQPVNCGTVSATTGEVFSQLKKRLGKQGDRRVRSLQIGHGLPSIPRRSKLGVSGQANFPSRVSAF